MAPENRVSAYQQHELHESGMSGRLRDQASEMCHQATDMVKDNPATSALLTFGLGLGVGLAVTALLAAPQRRRAPSWLEAHLPDNFSKQVADAVSRVLPEALARRM
jgi:hypothetical protein